MKLLTCIFAVSAILMAGADDGQTHSVLNSNSGPILLDSGSVITSPIQDTVLEQPKLEETILQEPLPVVPTIIENNLQTGGPILVEQPVIHPPVAVHRPTVVCTECRCVTCCCKPKKHVTTQFELVDPKGCVHVACAKVPVCCTNEAPTVSWKCRLLGRQIATLCWECCDHEIKVVVTRRGKVKVRD